MSKIFVNIDAITSEESRRQQEALRHAAEISPFVKGRTIGADLESWKETANAKIYNEKCENKEKTKITAKVIPPRAVISPKGSSLQNLDFEAINGSVVLREAEEKRRKLIRHEVLAAQERYVKLLKQCMSEERLSHENNMNKTMIEKHQNDHEIIRKAQEQSAKELQESEREIEVLRQQTKRQLQLISFQGISQYQSLFYNKYEAVAKLLISIDKKALLTCGDYNRKLKELVKAFELFILRIKSGECGTDELKLAQNLCRSLDELQMTISNDLESFVKKQQELQQQQQQRLKEELAAAVPKEVLPTPLANDAPNVPTSTGPPGVAVQSVATTGIKTVPTSTTTAPSISPESVPQFYIEILKFYQEKVERVKALQSEEELKKYRFACQRAVNIPINAISAVSPQHLQDKFEKLYSFISGQPLQSAEGQISVSDHPLGRDFCLLLMAKKFVNQGETSISSNPQAAFPVASIVLTLWKLLPEFGKLFLAYIYKESPLLVPCRAQSVQEYYDLKRQAGIARLYAAVMVSTGRQAEGSPHPYGIENAWRWLVSFVMLEPLPDISATLITEVLQIAGFFMWQSFGKQFTKLLFYIQKVYYPKLAAVDEGGPKTRLEMLLNNYISQHQIPQPQGMLPPTFW